MLKKREIIGSTNVFKKDILKYLKITNTFNKNYLSDDELKYEDEYKNEKDLKFNPISNLVSDDLLEKIHIPKENLKNDNKIQILILFQKIIKMNFL